MIQIKPIMTGESFCECGGSYKFDGLLWQGLHVCEQFTCERCKDQAIKSLPVNQAFLEQYSYYPRTGLIRDHRSNIIKDNWFSVKLKSMGNPRTEKVILNVDIFKKYEEILILNTLDYIYGHSLLFLLNLQRIIKAEDDKGIVVIVQPMMKWLIPEEYVAEIWTVNLSFNQLIHYYNDLSEKINSEMSRFRKVWLSTGHVIPTNENIDIKKFTGISRFDFSLKPEKPRITFIWRQDPDRLWIRNIFILKGFKKLRISGILIPFHYYKVLMYLAKLRKMLGHEYCYTVAGLGTYGKFAPWIQDKRVRSFSENIERMLCIVYAESILVTGVHGSSMLLPSAHAGMAISLMPSKRWGNYAEDILFVEDDVRLAAFQRRIVPLNINISDVCDIAGDMVKGREYFIRKFIHSNEL